MNNPERPLKPVFVLEAIVQALPRAEKYEITMPMQTLGYFHCDGGMRMGDETVAVRTLAKDAEDLSVKDLDAAVVVVLPKRDPEVHLIPPREGTWESNVRDGVAEGVKSACEHAGCSSGSACRLKISRTRTS